MEERRGRPSPPLSADVRYSAIRIAPSDPRRLYASGQDTAGAMFISRSDDGGQTWTRLPQPLPQFQRPYDLNLLLVSDASPDVLWARVSAPGLQLPPQEHGRRRHADAGDADGGCHRRRGGLGGWPHRLGLHPRPHVPGPEVTSRSPSCPCPTATRARCAWETCSMAAARAGSTTGPWRAATTRGPPGSPSSASAASRARTSARRGLPSQELCPSRWPQLAAILGAPTYGDGGVDSSPDAGTPDEQPPTDEKGGCSATSGLRPRGAPVPHPHPGPSLPARPVSENLIDHDHHDNASLGVPAPRRSCCSPPPAARRKRRRSAASPSTAARPRTRRG